MFARDPGGANTIVPLVRPLNEKGHQVRLFGKDVALERYVSEGLTGMNIMDFIQNSDTTSIKRLLLIEKPDLIVTGTSANDSTEKIIWKAAEELDIPVFAIVDQWLNYGVRFSPYGVSGLSSYHIDRVHSYLPTKILVMDETAKREAVKEGLDAGRIVITGQPHFEALLKGASIVNPEDLKQVRSRLGAAQGDYIMIFASEPISDTYHETDSSEHYWGYTERTIFKHLLGCVKTIADFYNGRIIIVLRPHPREGKTNYDDFLDGYLHDRISVVRDCKTDSIRLIMASDLVCGMSSMFLIEAVILDKPVVSIQIGLNRENPFVLARLGVLQDIEDDRQLIETVKSAILERALMSKHMDFIRNPIENIVDLVESYLCRN